MTQDTLLENLKKGKFTEDFSITHIEGLDGALTESAKSNELPKSIIVTVEAIHAGMTKNKTFYPADKLESSVGTWLTPYNKPVIKNHNTWEEPNGRVIDAVFKESTLKPETSTIELKLKITDPDVIEKVLDGRYQTLSIGGSTSEARCSICAKDVVETGWCGHSRGRKYEGKEAYWIIGEMEFNEISWVNVPADVNARVVHIQKEGTTGGRKESVDEKNKDNQQVEEDSNLIDNILGMNENAEGAEEQAGTEDKPEGQGVTEGAQTEDPKPDTANQTEGEKPKTDAEKLAEALNKITELEESVSTITQERDTLKNENAILTDSKTASDTQLQEQAEEITLLKEERDNFRNKNIKLAKTAHKYLAERAVDLRVVLGEAQKDERDALITEYAKTPAKVLENTISDLLDKPATSGVRESKKISNPGDVGIDTKELDENGEVTEAAKGAEKPDEITINDFAENIVKFISKQGQF